MSTSPRINPVAVLAIGLFGLVITASIDQMSLPYQPITLTVLESNPLHTINPAEPLLRTQTQDAEYILTIQTPSDEHVSINVSESTFSEVNIQDLVVKKCAYGRLSHRLYC